ISATAKIIDTPDQLVDISDRGDESPVHSHHLNFPWYQLKVGAEEINLFHKLLDDATRKLIQPNGNEDEK
ncbi:MAG: hypothetical protein JNM06_22755, partial [Blastocatellia bacterium]|nr:hypothetical protein [Blastocatellia bacterium]